MTFDADFNRILPETLRYEGLWSNNPADPGGATMRGVTQRVYDAYRHQQGQPCQSVRYISKAELRDIYYNNYWLPVTAGRIWPLNGALFDAAVNHGVKNALWLLERAKAAHPEYNNLPNAERQAKLTVAFLDMREQFFRAIVRNRPASGVFLNGWLRRCDEQRAFCTPGKRLGLLDLPADFPEVPEAQPRTDEHDAESLLVA